MGLTPNGHQLFKETTKRSRAIPDIDPTTGERRYKLHPTTGEPLYPRNIPEHYDHIRTFYLESEGNGNIVKIDWIEPTPEELAAVAREKGIKEMIPNLTATLYDSGIDIKDLVAAMKMIAQSTKGELVDEAPPAEAPEPEPKLTPLPEPVDAPVEVAEASELAIEPVETADESQPMLEAEKAPEDVIPPPTAPKIGLKYPFSLRPGGHWRLSDGSEYTGKKVDAQAAEAALQEVAAVP